jgi:hypothetical protein
MAAAAGAVPAAVAEPNSMNQVLSQVIGITRQNMRTYIRNNGFDTLDQLVTRKEEFARKACQNVRKQQGGNDADKNVTMVMEENLQMLILFVNFMYLVQRPLDYQEVTTQRLEEIRDYCSQLEDESKEGNLARFTDNCDKRLWFESVEAHLARVLGVVSGLPIVYVITANDLNAHQTFGATGFDDELKHRGRKDGRFWRGDNRSVFLILETLTFRTNAWTVVERFKGTTNGLGAWEALNGTYRGVGVLDGYRIKGENYLSTTWWDGTNKNMPFIAWASKLRKAFKDAGHDGDERYKVNKLLTHMKCAPLGNINLVITSSPH